MNNACLVRSSRVEARRPQLAKRDTAPHLRLDGKRTLEPVLLEHVEDAAAEPALVPVAHGLGHVLATDLDPVQACAVLRHLRLAHARKVGRLHTAEGKRFSILR